MSFEENNKWVEILVCNIYTHSADVVTRNYFESATLFLFKINRKEWKNWKTQKPMMSLDSWGHIIPGDLFDLCDLAIPMWPDPAWPSCVSVWSHLMSPQPVGSLDEYTHTRHRSTHSIRICSFKRLQLSYSTICWIPITHCGLNIITVITLS